ncbi:prephenate dehydrogenase [Pontibacillus marinus]|uniref:Prephenate dehydrogenase n=1 Tax=Pontibacillus marinus BH030004 = DSM 16465 TaxID=1385511 RepID=A0A0A5GK00_9BACI|nr:prephenate dehydrogenase [Pontibacillus marinus]KGX91480.1 prephenate dehydrogenase [Pontibacillus marinus BH030004 = DSM 16465]
MSQKVVVIGLGLIGGSISLAIKKEHQAKIVGCDINEEQLKLAQSLLVVDEYELDIHKAVVDADLIIVATPVLQTENILNLLLTCDLKEGAIITDVGSTKENIMENAHRFFHKGVVFIGGHPMAGSHKSGVSASKAHLFENAFYILTKGEQVSDEDVKNLRFWLNGTNANFIEMSPHEHDEIVGVISHFPHIIASSLVQLLQKRERKDIDVKRLAAGGFRDITRIASSNPTMWRDITLHNREVLIEVMDEWINEMSSIREIINDSSKEKIFSFFDDAKRYRDGLPEKKKGALPAFYDLYIDVVDHPGAIATVTAILAKDDINLTNIRIIETREDMFGVLCLSFRNDQELEVGKVLLEKNGFECYSAS